MPLYVSPCQPGHQTEDLRKHEDREHLMACPECGWSAQPIMTSVCRPRFATGIKGHTSREANSYVRSKPRGTNDGYEG